MAIRKANDSAAVSGWNSKMPFPQDRYTIRCIEEDTTPSKAGNPMYTLEWEICQGAPVVLGDKMIDVDGLKVRQWLTTKIKTGDDWDKEKSDKAFGKTRDLLVLLGFPEDGEIDDENPPPFFKGKVVDAIVTATKQQARKLPTPEQLKRGQVGDVVKDAFGKEVITYQLKIDQILGLSNVETNRPY